MLIDEVCRAATDKHIYRVKTEKTFFYHHFCFSDTFESKKDSFQKNILKIVTIALLISKLNLSPVISTSCMTYLSMT